MSRISKTSCLLLKICPEGTKVILVERSISVEQRNRSEITANEQL